MSDVRPALVVSRFRDPRPDILLLERMEQACLACGSWKAVYGPVLFRPLSVSTRLFTGLHSLLRPVLRRVELADVIISLGLPYRHYFFGKTFPYFTADARLRVLWSYDIWEPRFEEIAAMVREARINLFLISSRQAAQYFQELDLPDCDVHWVPEVLDVSDYQSRPWMERTIDVLAFGRSHPRYHNTIAAECQARGLRYIFQRFNTAEDLMKALGDAKISICFPQSMTHPAGVGVISTVTLRFLESMAAKCVVLGGTPLEAEEMFGYNPIVEVDWGDPVGQIQEILQNPVAYLELVERNYAEVEARHQTTNFVDRVNKLIARRLDAQRQ
jgi:hypothetical protein